ncbi:MAG TPA: hypothetical protein VGG18_13155, partial [Granulicella sp.]
NSDVSKNDQPDPAHPVLSAELMARAAIYGKESDLEAGEEVSSQATLSRITSGGDGSQPE